MSDHLLPDKTSGGTARSINDLFHPNSKTEAEIAELTTGRDIPIDPQQDLWNLIGQHQQGGLPDPTAPDYVARNQSGEILSTGLLTIVNMLVFAPAGLRLGALKDQRTGNIVGWDLRPYVGNEYTDHEVKTARAAAERRWPGIEERIVSRFSLGARVNVLAVEMEDPKRGPTQEELDRARGVERVTQRTLRREFDEEGRPTQAFEMTGEVSCALCFKDLVGPITDFEPRDVEDGGGWLCGSCSEDLDQAFIDAIDAERLRREEIANREVP